MAWRRWMAPLLIGAALGVGLTMLLAGHRNLNLLATVLVAIQIPILIWDVVVTTMVLRRVDREAEALMRDIRARQQSQWN